MRSTRAPEFLPSRVFALHRGDDHIQSYSTENQPVLVPAEVLAKHRPEELAAHVVVDADDGVFLAVEMFDSLRPNHAAASRYDDLHFTNALSGCAAAHSNRSSFSFSRIHARMRS